MKKIIMVVLLTVLSIGAEIEIIPNSDFIKIIHGSRSSVTIEHVHIGNIKAVSEQRYKEHFRKIWNKNAYNSSNFRDKQVKYSISLYESEFFDFEISKNDYFKLREKLGIKNFYSKRDQKRSQNKLTIPMTNTSSI